MKAFILVDGKIEETTSHPVVREAQLAQRRMWVDLGPRSPESDALLAEAFGLHSLVIEDIWLDRDLPKMDDLGSYLYVMVHGPRPAPENARSRLDLWVLDLVVGPNFVISHHDDTELADAVAQDLRQSPRLLGDGPIWLAHRLLDRVIDRFLPVIERIGNRLDEFEGRVIDGATKGKEEDLTPSLFRLKRTIQALGRITRHQQQVLARLGEGGLERVPRDALPFFRDISDHFMRVADLADSYRDNILNVLDAHLSVQSNVMNQAVRRLTVISTVLLPLNLIASIYGMNFKHMPELSWEFGYPAVLLLMATIATTVLTWARHKRWI